MLHILLMILKIIGIIIAVVLGLILLVTLVLILAPFHYTIDAECGGNMESLELEVRYRWLYRLISGYFIYRNQDLEWKARVAFKSFPKKEEKKRQESPAKKEEVKQVKQEEPKKQTEIIKKEEAEETKEKQEEKSEMQGTTAKEDKKQRKERKFRVSLTEKIKGFFRKIKFTIRKICDTIKMIAEKKEKLLAFLEDEVHRSAFRQCKICLLRLLRFLKPKCVKGRIHYGFSDPYDTGRVLAALSVGYPFYGETLAIEPDFEEKILEGELHIKGKIRGIYAGIILFQLVKSKAVRTTYSHVRDFNKVNGGKQHGRQ